jgi:predicted kinase
MKRLVIMTVGMTHSGKSTFAQMLKSRLENAIVIDQDNHAEFLQTYYEKLLPKKGPNLIKHALTKTIVDYAVHHSDCHLILSNSNRDCESRAELLPYYKTLGFTTILVHFDLPIELLKERIVKSKRDKLRLRTAATYEEVLERQHKQTGGDPAEGEADHLFRVKQEADIPVIRDLIVSIFK